MNRFQLLDSLASECKKLSWLATVVLGYLGLSNIDLVTICLALGWFLGFQAVAHIINWGNDPTGDD